MPISKNRVFALGVTALAAILLGFTIVGWATGTTHMGGQVAAGNVVFVLEPVVYDESSGEVSGVARFKNNNGIMGIQSGSTFSILRFNPSTGAVTTDVLSCTPSLSMNNIIWSFSYTVPSGLKFMGVKVTGSYIDAYNVTRSFNSSLGTHTDMDQF